MYKKSLIFDLFSLRNVAYLTFLSDLISLIGLCYYYIQDFERYLKFSIK